MATRKHPANRDDGSRQAARIDAASAGRLVEIATAVRVILPPVLRIHTSHRTEVLVDAFVRNLADERRRAGPFAPVRVVVPNGNVESYLRFGVAERLGIAANFEMTFLRKLLAGIAHIAIPDARLADATVAEAHLLALLHDPAALDRAELAPVRAYLFAQGTARDAVDRRRCQLAAVLAHLFDEYEGSRADLLAAWRRGERATAGAPETWQRVLWLAIFGEGGRLERQAQRDGIRRLSLETLWDEAVRTMPAAFAGLRVHVFGLSYISAAYHRMLGQLGRSSDVHVYTLNPCREDLGAAAGADLHLALSLWGRPARENLELLARLPGATVDARFGAPAPKTLLEQLQRDIAGGAMPRSPGLPLTDDSLRVLPCPSLRRELEVVAAEIWQLVRTHRGLRLADIAVIVPEQQRALYLAQLPAVFRESCDLPHTLADSAANVRHRTAEAIRLLVELPFSSLSRKDLLPLLTHPCLMARFRSAAGADWRALPAELGIVRGAEQSDFDAAYLERDLFSWQQGLTRLALGAVADPAPEAGTAELSFEGQDYLPGPSIESDDDGVLGFGLLAASLIADARFASGATGPRERPLGEWLEFLRRLVRTYVAVADDAAQALVARFVAALDELDEAGLETAVSYRVAAELAGRALARLPEGGGAERTNGVTVATLLPMRAIPFRAIFVLGLGQGHFPRAQGRHELDLRCDERRPGDVDGREQDLYMFLELLLSARDHLSFSYVSRDEVTGDELPASAALLELRAILGHGYLGGSALARFFCDDLRQRPPLRRYDDSETRRAVLPVAEAEHEAKRLGAQARAAPLAREPARVELAPPDATAQPAPLIEIPLIALRRFLEDPLQGSARFALGMAVEEDDGGVELENEPFDLAAWLRTAIVSRTMISSIVAARGQPEWDAVVAAHERETLAAELRGRAPVRRLRRALLDKERDVLRAWHAALPHLVGGEARPWQRFQLVSQLAATSSAADAELVQWPAARLELALPSPAGGSARPVTVSVVGRTGLWGAVGSATALRFTLRKHVCAEKLAREDLASFVEHVVLTAAASDRGEELASAVFYADKGVGDFRVRRFARLTQPEARTYLGRLCAALLGGGPGEVNRAIHPYLLPYEAVLASHHKHTSVSDEIQRLIDGSDRAGFSSLHGPVPSATERYAPPDEEQAQRLIEERFGLFFALAGTNP